MFRPGGVGGDVGQVDFGLLAGGELDFCFFCRFFQALQGERVFGEVDAAVFFEFGDEVVDDARVEVFAAEEGVAVGGEDFKLLFAFEVNGFDDGDVEGAATEVIDRDFRVARATIHAVGQGGCGRFVDDALDVQPGDAAGVFGCLALAVVKVGRHGDDGVGNFFAEEVFHRFFHFHQDARRYFRRCHFFVHRFYPGVAVVGLDDFVGDEVDVFLYFFFVEAAANQALDGVEGVFRVGDRLTFRRLADQHFAVVGEGDDGRRGARAFGVFDDARLVAVHDGYA